MLDGGRTLAIEVPAAPPEGVGDGEGVHVAEAESHQGRVRFGQQHGGLRDRLGGVGLSADLVAKLREGGG